MLQKQTKLNSNLVVVSSSNTCPWSLSIKTLCVDQPHVYVTTRGTSYELAMRCSHKSKDDIHKVRSVNLRGMIQSTDEVHPQVSLALGKSTTAQKVRQANGRSVGQETQLAEAWELIAVQTVTDRQLQTLDPNNDTHKQRTIQSRHNSHTYWKDTKLMTHRRLGHDQCSATRVEDTLEMERPWSASTPSEQIQWSQIQ